MVKVLSYGMIYGPNRISVLNSPTYILLPKTTTSLFMITYRLNIWRICSTYPSQEFNELDNLCQDLNITSYSHQIDKWSYTWGNDKYSSSKAYNMIIDIDPAHVNFRW